MSEALWIASSGVGAWILTRWVRQWALSRALMDIPNGRSSHVVPTPRGGGLAIVAVVLITATALGVFGILDRRAAIALVGGGLMVAGVGFRDDWSHLRARVRVTVHFAAAAWAVAWLGGLPALDWGGGVARMGTAGAVLAVVGVVWCINLYNFMDGIDGIAGTEALVAGTIGGLLLWSAGAGGLALCAAAVAASSAGFLAWNWQPARIFMGDVGSGFLGFVFAVLALASERSGAVPLLVWILLAGVFVFDASVTLLRRILRGARPYEAHRSHAYQRLVQSGWTHARVCVTLLALNALLAGLAVVGASQRGYLLEALGAGILLLTIAYVAAERVRPMDAAG
jgi:Fuc2NAc and GlcNAc transferase